jgi:hypothetical protein
MDIQEIRDNHNGSETGVVEKVGDAGGASTDETPTPGDLLRSLPGEANKRGSRFISAQAMQARLFSVYDAAAAAEDALALVQEQLSLTLSRSYYEPGEVTAMAARLDDLLTADDAGGQNSALPTDLVSSNE